MTLRGILNTPLPKLTFGAEFIVGISLNIEWRGSKITSQPTSLEEIRGPVTIKEKYIHLQIILF